MEPFEVVTDGDVTWRFDRTFLESRWTCTWGRGCPGIRPEAAPHRGEGCCTYGADLDGEAESLLIGALAATLPPERFQHHSTAARYGVFADAARTATRVVDGACVFLNRPEFAGGAGCALHLAADDAGEPPRDWKPSVCWQVPIRVEVEPGSDGREVATVRRWERADWGDDAEHMGWWCTDDPDAQGGDRPVVEAMADELTEIVGAEVYVELRRRLA